MEIKAMTYQEARKVWEAYYNGEATRQEFDQAMAVINGNQTNDYDPELARIDRRRYVDGGWNQARYSR